MIKTSLVMPASHIGVPLPVPAAPLPVQVSATVPGKAADDGPQDLGPCHPGGRPI